MGHIKFKFHSSKQGGCVLKTVHRDAVNLHMLRLACGSRVLQWNDGEDWIQLNTQKDLDELMCAVPPDENAPILVRRAGQEQDKAKPKTTTRDIFSFREYFALTFLFFCFSFTRIPIVLYLACKYFGKKSLIQAFKFVKDFVAELSGDNEEKEEEEEKEAESSIQDEKESSIRQEIDQASSEEDDELASKVKLVLALGFSNKGQIRRLLKEHNGDTKLVVEALLG